MSNARTANLLGALSTEVCARLDAINKEHPNANSSALAALNVLAYYDGCSNGALAQALRLSHTATVRLVDKLEADGLVKSTAADDKRSVALHLTARGRKKAEAMIQERCGQLCALVGLLDAQQRAQLDGILETLLRSLVIAAHDADHICRLCDGSCCPADRCPVHCRHEELFGAAKE